jgi:hypothetical protein
MSHGFARSSNYFYCYFFRTLIEMIIAIGLLLILSVKCFPVMQG